MAATWHRPCNKLAVVWMRSIRLLFVIGVSVWSAVAAGNQAAPPMTLSGALRAHVKDAPFGIVTSIRGLPLGVRDGLQTCSAVRHSTSPSPERGFKKASGASRPCRFVGWSRRGARTTIASSTMSAAASPTRGTWRCFTGRLPRPDSSGAVPRQAAWRQSTTFGTPSCPARSRARLGPGNSSVAQDPRGLRTIICRHGALDGQTQCEDSQRVAFGLQPAHGYCL